MRRPRHIIWSAAWTALLVLLGLYQVALSPRQGHYSEDENRMTAAFPAFSAEELLSGEFSGGLESWLLDNFPLRGSAVRFSQRLRDGVSLVSYNDYLAVMQAAEDPLADSAGDETPAPAPPPPAPAVSVPQPASSAAGAQPGARQPVTFPQKPAPNNADWPAALGVYMQADGQVATLESFGFSQVTAVAGHLDAVARLLPEGGGLSFTMVPQAMYVNRFVNAAGRQRLYSDFEACLYAYSDDNVQVVSTVDILNAAILRDEYVYFRTDMHWTPYGTHLVYSEMVRGLGFAPTPYEDFDIAVEDPFLGTYYRDNPTGYMQNNADTLELVAPAGPYTYRRLAPGGALAEMPLLNMDARANDRYTVYLGGPGAWSVIESDNGQEDNCLVLCDSFGLAYVPMLAGQYRQVHYYDPRYFDAAAAGGSVGELIKQYGITDCYVVVGDLHCFGSDFLAQAERQL